MQSACFGLNKAGVKYKTLIHQPGILKGKTDWKLLVFLLLFLNFKLVIKLVAVVLIYLLRPGFKFGLHWKRSRLPLLYILLIAIALFNALLSGQVTDPGYLLVLGTGTMYWVLCLLAMHQVKLAAELNEPQVLHQTILVFLLINIVVSLAVYTGIVWEAGTINPYRYQGNYQKYFIGTGDYIKGITLDTSTTNAVISSLGVIYLLLQDKYGFALLCMLVLLLTGSNLTNLLLCAVLLYIFCFQSSRNQKSIIIACLLMLVVFLVKVSPQNNQYIIAAGKKIFGNGAVSNQAGKADIPVTEKPDSILSPEERKQKFAQFYLDSINISLDKKYNRQPIAANLTSKDFLSRPVIPGDSIHTPSFQHKNDTNQAEKKLISFIEANAEKLCMPPGAPGRANIPGKIAAFRQTFVFLQAHPLKIFTGNGMGNFSSKLAFKATATNVAGSYPAQFAYVHDDFERNHLSLYLYYFTNKDDYHSVVNSPNAVYDQLLGEYGLAGLVALAFYALFFLKRLSLKSAAIPLILLMLGAFFMEYWFEQLSVVVFFELLVFVNIKETELNKIHAAA